jgi:hypothetical protein
MITPEEQQQALKDDQWLRKNIFWSKCKFGGKCCNVIIDSSSTKDMVIIVVVEKLGLV